MLTNKARCAVAITLCAMFLCAVLPASGSINGKGQVSELLANQEPNMEIASIWWRDLENIWTPVGWRDHAFRFNVLFDGTILTHARRHKDYLNEASCFQMMFRPATGSLQPGPDDNMVVQGWKDTVTPVLWSEWPGVTVLRQEVFAHVPGGEDVRTGVEPLFAWVRLEVHGCCDGLPRPETVSFIVKINSPYVSYSMSKGRNIRYSVDDSRYPKDLSADSERYDLEKGLRIIEDGRLVRMGVAPGQECSVTFAAKKPTERDSMLKITLPARTGSQVDLLIPFLPVEPSVFDEELSLGYDGALAEADRYWSRTPSTAARFEVPEEYINQVIKRNLQMTEVIAEKDPATGKYSLLSGSWGYSGGLWLTPGSMTMTMLLDTMGYHSVLRKYLEVFRKEQGTVVPPGPAFKLHPGYLSSPKSVTSIDWLPDHGALLWVISQHALLTGDREFIREWLPVIIKACDFIRDARRIEDHEGVRGILPPAVASDQKKALQGVWTDGWNYKGLVNATRLLRRVNHPRAEEFAAEAIDYKECFQREFRKKIKTMPAWTDSAGRVHHQIPTGLINLEDHMLRPAFHLDTGPLFLVFAGLMDATDEEMKSTLLWFREGPAAKVYRPEADCWQLPSLHHEMSSCEPCYSWNVFHSWQLGDRQKFLEGMYSQFAGAYSRQTYSVCETRGGVTGTTHWLPSVYMARLSVIDDQIAEYELHLLRLMPLAWLKTDREAIFDNMPTEFGPIDLRVKLASGGKELQVTFSDKFRISPKQVVLHVPPVKGLKRVVLNGEALKWNGKTSSLIIGTSRT